MPKQLLIAGILATMSPWALAQETPPPADFYYCAHFYRWIEPQTGSQSPLKQHFANSLALFDSGATILSGGTPNKDLYQSSAEALRATLKKASDEQRNMPELAKAIDADCWEKQRRYTNAILKKSEEIGAAQKLYFTHSLPRGKVDSADIERHREFIKAQSGVTVDDQKEMVVYSFSRRIGEASESVHHVFTKAPSPAHPAVVFLLKRRASKDKPPALTADGSYAGPEKEFAAMRTVLFMMNQGL